MILISLSIRQDLKAFNYYYYFAYPCPSTPIFEQIDGPKTITSVFDSGSIDALTKLYFSLSSEERSFFIVTHNNTDQFNYSKLGDKISVDNKNENFVDGNLDEIYFCFSDPCPKAEYGGWPLRLFLLMLTHLWYVCLMFIFSSSSFIYKLDIL